MLLQMIRRIGQFLVEFADGHDSVQEPIVETIKREWLSTRPRIKS